MKSAEQIATEIWREWAINHYDCEESFIKPITAAIQSERAEVERLKAEIQGVLDYMPEDSKVQCREGLCATLAVSVAKLAKLRENRTDERDKLKSELDEALRLLRRVFAPAVTMEIPTEQEEEDLEQSANTFLSRHPVKQGRC